MNRRISCLCLITLGLATGAPPAQAQSAGESLRVLSVDYQPASTAMPSLDLRAGRYLLELRGPLAGVYLGRLRGPRNEWVSQDLRFVGSVCVGTPTLSTEAAPGGPSVNPLRLVLNTPGGCRAEALLPSLGLTSINVSRGEPDCDPPEEIEQIASTDPGPACSPPYEPEFPITAPRPDVKPRAEVNLAGRSYRWSDRIVLDAGQALTRTHGRCVFDYAYTVENSGRAPSGASDSSLLLDTRQGLSLDARPLGMLAPGASQRVQGRLALPPGHWRVYVHADAGDRIGEANGANNARVTWIQVSGDCGG